MRRCHSSAVIAGNCSTKYSAIVDHEPAGNTVQLGPTPSRVGNGATEGRLDWRALVIEK
jgi:hypothetical protein